MEGRDVSLHFPSLDANFLASSLSRLFSLLGHSIKSGAASRRHSLRCLTYVSLSLHKFLAMAFEREGTDAATRASVFPCAACGRVRRNDGSTALLNVYYPWPKKWIRLTLAKAMTRESRIFSLCHRLHRASGKRLTGIWLHRFETDSSRDSVVEYTMSHSIGIERLRDSRNLSTSVKWGRLHICLSRAMHACIMRIVLFLEDSRISRQSGAPPPIMIN